MSPVPVARLCILAAFAIAAVPAFAGEKIAVVATGLEAQSQLDEVFCVSQNCVPTEKVLSGGKLDPKKLEREHVKFTVTATRGKRGLDVELKDGSGKVRYEEQLEAGTGGKLAIGPLVTLAAKMIDAIENGTTIETKAAAPDEKKLAKMRAWAKKQQLAKTQKLGKKKFAARGPKRSGRT